MQSIGSIHTGANQGAASPLALANGGHTAAVLDYASCITVDDQLPPHLRAAAAGDLLNALTRVLARMATTTEESAPSVWEAEA